VNTPWLFILPFSYSVVSPVPDDIGRDPAGRQHHSTPEPFACRKQPGRGFSLPGRHGENTPWLVPGRDVRLVIMMNTTNKLVRILGLLSINAAMAVFFSGCSTPDQHSFNGDYNEHLPTQPVYFIEDKTTTSFTITVKEGTPSNGSERVTDVKIAASTVAKDECQKLGWEKWNLNYIEDDNRGWMHVVVAKVTRK
jgi:hypothetical protein